MRFIAAVGVSLAVVAVGPVLDSIFAAPHWEVFVLARIPLCAFALGFLLPRGVPGASAGVGLAVWYTLVNLDSGDSGATGKAITKMGVWLVLWMVILLEVCGYLLGRDRLPRGRQIVEDVRNDRQRR